MIRKIGFIDCHKLEVGVLQSRAQITRTSCEQEYGASNLLACALMRSDAHFIGPITLARDRVPVGASRPRRNTDPKLPAEVLRQGQGCYHTLANPAGSVASLLKGCLNGLR